METTETIIEEFFERVETFGKTTLELTKLKLLEKATMVTTYLLARIVVVILITMFTVVVSIGIALMLGEFLGKAYYGFFIVAAFYLVAGILMYFFLHKWIKDPVSELIIKHALK